MKSPQRSGKFCVCDCKGARGEADDVSLGPKSSKRSTFDVPLLETFAGLILLDVWTAFGAGLTADGAEGKFWFVGGVGNLTLPGPGGGGRRPPTALFGLGLETSPFLLWNMKENTIEINLKPSVETKYKTKCEEQQ